MNRRVLAALAVAAGGSLLLALALLFGFLRREIVVETVLPSVGGVEAKNAVLFDGKDAGEVESIELTQEGAVFHLRMRGAQIREGSEVVLRPSRLRRPAVIEIRSGPRGGSGVGRFVRLPGRVAYDIPDGLVDPPFRIESPGEGPGGPPGRRGPPGLEGVRP